MKKLQKSRGGVAPAYVAPELLLHKFIVENGFASSEGDISGETSDDWYKGNEEIL